MGAASPRPSSRLFMDKRRSAPPTMPARAARDRRTLSYENNAAVSLVDRVHSTTLEEGSTRHHRHEAAAASAKREISNNLREDWTWPQNASQSANPIRISASTQWRERDSDSGSSSSPSPPPESPLSPSNPYRFHSPDSILHLAVPRKRRRRRQLRQEMSWNEGLATYTRRRDAWTGARVSSPETLLDSSEYQSGSPATPIHGVLSASLNPPSQEIDCESPPLLPLPPPLLPLSNPIRAAITPATYPSIYTKHVVRGLTPIVPINLSDMVGALVQGWKDDGEWPPQSGVADAELEARSGVRAFVVGTKNGTALAKRGVGKMKKALGLGEEGGGIED